MSAAENGIVTTRSSDERSSAVVEAVFAGNVSCLVVLDCEFNFIRVNQAYAAVCGKAIGDFRGRNHFEMYPSGARAIFEDVVRSKQPFETRAMPFVFPDHPDRGVTLWDWTLTPVFDAQGEVEYLIFSLNEVTEYQRAEERLEASKAQLRQLTSSLHAQLESQRTLIARELHDELGQLLTVMKMDLARAASDLASPREAENISQHLNRINGTIDRALEKVRDLTTWLRPAALDFFGLVAAIEGEVPRLLSKSGVRCVVRADADIDGLTAEQSMAVFRIVQEAVTNVVRHSAATVVAIVIRKSSDVIVTCVLDNGAGIAGDAIRSPRALGLTGMRERAMLAGGVCRIGRRRVRGTRVVVTLPRRQAESADVAV